MVLRAKDKLNSIDWDTAAKAVVGAGGQPAFEIPRCQDDQVWIDYRPIARLRESASHLVHVLRRVKQPLHIGKTILEWSELGNKEIVAIQGL